MFTLHALFSYFLVEKSYFFLQKSLVLRSNKKIIKKNIILSNTIAKNPLLIVGSILNRTKFKKLYLAYFDGNPKNEQEFIIMEETLVSLKKLSKKTIKFYSITKNFFDIPILLSQFIIRL